MLPLSLALVLSASPTLSLRARVDGQPPAPGWVYAREGQRVVLEAAVTGATPTSFAWFKLEPTVESVDNTQPSFHFVSIPYEAIELERCRDQPRCEADVTPTRLKATHPGLGTMAFQVKATLPGGKELASPGLEAQVSGGLSRQVMRVTFRQSDSYLGYLTELFNTPYIFGSAGEGAKNQSDLLIGSDCADLAVYGRRRMGRRAEYTSSFGIDRQAPLVAAAVAQSDAGVALDAQGRPITAARPGDLLHFPGSRHVAVLYEDREPKGVLDANDLMLHTCWAPPTIEPVGASSCASFPWRILRFPDAR
ncbi:MAG: hypothetical protein K1X89_28200 [Myxococcaceae bacterium]|nr:hypothetical protein [Myxococcaceae bacterium]